MPPHWLQALRGPNDRSISPRGFELWLDAFEGWCSRLLGWSPGFPFVPTTRFGLGVIQLTPIAELAPALYKGLARSHVFLGALSTPSTKALKELLTHSCFGAHLDMEIRACLLYTSDAADEEDSVDLGGRRIIKKKKKKVKTCERRGRKHTRTEI
eukprot:TRINITY_DN26138_c0_g1_i3.p1 TRINITY_DN26138_c0_g1~~TRINITY_DN26138_c0_g1_i3.p1  ORF type:complete len:155 (-),score=9.77 TRINITY_DN26138_c0_g1_i3:51-515(-)